MDVSWMSQPSASDARIAQSTAAWLRTGSAPGSRDHRARIGNLHAMARAVRAAAPSRVHQPDARLVLRDLVAEHPRVEAGRQRQERRAKTCTEGGGGFGDALFRARDLGRVAG